jgi:hypothetical protein
MNLLCRILIWRKKKIKIKRYDNRLQMHDTDSVSGFKIKSNSYLSFIFIQTANTNNGRHCVIFFNFHLTQSKICSFALKIRIRSVMGLLMTIFVLALKRRLGPTLRVFLGMLMLRKNVLVLYL